MKVVSTRAPGDITVDFSAIPSHQTDAMCRTLISCIGKYFENPAVKADYERWKQERQQKRGSE